MWTTFYVAGDELSILIAKNSTQWITMEMRFIRAVQFTRLLKANGRLREFNFRRGKSPDGYVFYVNVCDDRGDRILFHMEKNGEKWQLAQQLLPPWVLQQENKLHDLIEEESANFTS